MRFFILKWILLSVSCVCYIVKIKLFNFRQPTPWYRHITNINHFGVKYSNVISSNWTDEWSSKSNIKWIGYQIPIFRIEYFKFSYFEFKQFFFSFWFHWYYHRVNIQRANNFCTEFKEKLFFYKLCVVVIKYQEK